MAKAKRIAQLSDLTPDTQNANKGTERGRYMVEASLTETGAGRSIVADKDGRIIAGNKTLEAWAGMGGAVKIVETDGQELVVVQRTDLDLSDPKGKARKLAYYDNRAGQVGLEWDAEQLLADVNAGVDLAAMFKADEIAELLAGVKGGEADAEPQIDQAEELNKKWQVKTGDLWRIGAHRLLCGDSTKAADVARLMGGERARMVLTDPPYALFGNSTGVSGIADDKMVRPFFRDIAKMAIEFTLPFSHVYICCDWHSAFTIQLVMQEAGLTAKNLCIWDKGDGGIGANYQICYEMIWFFANSPKAQGTLARKATGERTVNGVPNIWRFPRSPAERHHNAEKPVALFSVPISNGCTTGESVIDLFAGGGTTLVACENLGRKCRAVEISPAYCAVILERMAQAFPKLEITRDDGAG